MNQLYLSLISQLELMVKLLYYGLSPALMGYCSRSSHKKRLKGLSNTLKTIASNNQLASLSSIQIGETIQYFVMLNRQYLKSDQWHSYSRAKPAHYRGFLNAQLTDHSEQKKKQWEICSSYPGIKMLIERPSSIRIMYRDQELKEISQQMHGFQARLAQHQIDHYLGFDYLKKCEKVEITNDQLREKHQQQCDQLLTSYRNVMVPGSIDTSNVPEFHRLRQFITYSIVDKSIKK